MRHTNAESKFPDLLVITKGEARTLVILRAHANRINREWICEVGLKVIASQVGCGVRYLRRVLCAMEKKGLIQRVNASGYTSKIKVLR